MGVVSSPLLDSLDLKSIIQGNEEKSDDQLSESLWNKVVQAQAKRRWRLVRKRRLPRKNGGHMIRSRKTKRILMKKRAGLERFRRPANVIERKVRTLKKLIPNSESSGLDGLFRETADYILALQMRVKVMQIMVKTLTGSEN
ncbi:putative Transcription factor [Melia azedarach]|uniref:Transcription factor n=1 Tax=Melia azedarach TaxID=155640 RepID=A0ACC1YVX3_MELAZ|nr:putative Transcription factor [Melia azedarach]